MQVEDKYRFISVSSDDDDDIVIEAGVHSGGAAGDAECGRASAEGVSAHPAEPVDADGVADGAGLFDSAFADGAGEGAQGGAGSVGEAAAARPRTEAAPVNDLADLKGGMSSMQKGIVVVALLLLAAFVAWYVML